MNQKNNIKVNIDLLVCGEEINIDCFYEILSLDIENLITDKILEHNLALKRIEINIEEECL